MLTNLPFTIASIHQAYQQGVSVDAVLNESLQRLSDIDDEGIYLHVASQTALNEAVAALGPFDLTDKPLWGIPFAVKDNIDVLGMPTSAGCEAFRYIAQQDAYVVSLLKQAGAIVMGKTNLDQFATGLVGVRTPYPAPNNAINAALVPGGSSSGSAVAVAHGQVCFSLGTDTAGSGRIPAALNNIIGLKPTLGSISNRGGVPACRSLDTVSLFALCVEDAAQVYACCRQHDPQDPFSQSYCDYVQHNVPAHFTMAVPNASSLIIDEPAQQQAYQQALNYWRKKGALIVEIDFQPFYEVAKLLYEGPWVAERLAALTTFMAKHREALYPVTRTIIESAHQFSASDAFNASYRLRELEQQTRAIWDTIDVMCVPSMPGLVYKRDIESDPIGPNSRLGTYTNFVNLLDLCAIAVPGKVREDGLPSSITFIAQNNRDGFIHALGADYHAHQASTQGATQHVMPNPATALTAPRTTNINALTRYDEIAIAVVGAHMSGLPLNHQLTARGARFLMTTQTAKQYNLYQLSDESPLRPGLIRDEEGHTIALEIWALPKTQFADFMTQIPSPLCIGSITLADKQRVKGFLCEPHGLKNSRNITEFGGWREYVQATEA